MDDAPVIISLTNWKTGLNVYDVQGKTVPTTFCYLIFLWIYKLFLLLFLFLLFVQCSLPWLVIGRWVAGHHTSRVLLQATHIEHHRDDLDTLSCCLEATCPLVVALLSPAGLILVISHVLEFPWRCVWVKWGWACKAENGRGFGEGREGTDGQMSHAAKILLIFFSLS